MGLGCQLLILEPLIPVLMVKSLGAILDASLSVETQITNVAKLVFSHLYQVRKLVLFLSPYDLATVTCNSHFQTRLLKLALVWATLATDLEAPTGQECSSMGSYVTLSLSPYETGTLPVALAPD